MKYCFIVGCPRSGTTWLRALLAQHPRVASTRETHLFDTYVYRLQESWIRERTNDTRVGLRPIVTDAQFTALCRDFAGSVMKCIAERNPRAKVTLEKTPQHVRYVPLILNLFPEARFIHVVRDPRGAVASLCAAGRSWGHAWGWADPIDNARRWVSSLSAGREITALTDRVVTVKYETLLKTNGWQVIQDLFKFMNLEADEHLCRNTMATCTIEYMRKQRTLENSERAARVKPTEFFRKGKADSWKDELSMQDVGVVEYLAGDLMHECGYTPVTRFAARQHKPWRLKRRELIEGLEWRTNRMVTRLFNQARHLA